MHENNLVFLIIVGGIVCFFVIVLPTIAWIIQTRCERKYKRSHESNENESSSSIDEPDYSKATIIRTPSKIVYMAPQIFNMCSPQEYSSICEMGNRYVKEFSSLPMPVNYCTYSAPPKPMSFIPISIPPAHVVFEKAKISSSTTTDKKSRNKEPPPYEPRLIQNLPEITNIYVEFNDPYVPDREKAKKSKPDSKYYYKENRVFRNESISSKL